METLETNIKQTINIVQKYRKKTPKIIDKQSKHEQQQEFCLNNSNFLKNYKNIQNQIQQYEYKKQKIYLKYNAKYYKLFINYKQKYKNKLITEHIYPNGISICYHKKYKFLINIKISKLLIIKPLSLLNNIKINEENKNKNNNNLKKFNYYNYYHKKFTFEYFNFLDVMIVKFNNNDVETQDYGDSEDYWNIVKNSTFYEKNFVDFDEQKNMNYKNINLQFYWKNNFLQEIRILDFKESSKFVN